MTIVCLGDSLTYGYEVARPKTWPALAAEETGERILNRGVNGLMTTGMLATFTRDVINEKAHTVLLMGGANDILSGLDLSEPEKNMAEMIGRAQAAGIRPLLGIPVPFCPPIREDWDSMADFPGLSPLYSAYMNRLLAIAAARGCGIVDFRSGMSEHVRKAGGDARSYFGDGIHLNEKGHAVFAAVFIQALRDNGILKKNAN